MAGERIRYSMPEPTNPEEGQSSNPNNPTAQRESTSAHITHGIPTSPESQRTADEIAAELAREFQQRRGGATTTFEPARPIPTERPAKPVVTPRRVATGIGLGVLGTLGALVASRFSGANADVPTPVPTKPDDRNGAATQVLPGGAPSIAEATATLIDTRTTPTAEPTKPSTPTVAVTPSPERTPTTAPTATPSPTEAPPTATVKPTEAPLAPTYSPDIPGVNWQEVEAIKKDWKVTIDPALAKRTKTPIENVTFNAKYPNAQTHYDELMVKWLGYMYEQSDKFKSQGASSIENAMKLGKLPDSPDYTQIAARIKSGDKLSVGGLPIGADQDYKNIKVMQVDPKKITVNYVDTPQLNTWTFTSDKKQASGYSDYINPDTGELIINIYNNDSFYDPFDNYSAADLLSARYSNTTGATLIRLAVSLGLPGTNQSLDNTYFNQDYGGRTVQLLDDLQQITMGPSNGDYRTGPYLIAPTSSRYPANK